MEKKELTPETINKVKTLERMPYEQYKALILNSTINRLVKLKHPKTIFFDESDACFYYLNPFHCELQKCGEFNVVLN